jgi:putative peptidoglycan lipid II flippase
VNTIFLLLFLRKNPCIAVGRAMKSAVGYTLRMAVLSAAAVVPVLFLAPRLAPLFAGRGRFLAWGLPLLISGRVYGALGIALLLITKDKQIRALRKMFRRTGA